MSVKSLKSKTEQYVFELLKKELPSEVVYHNFKHTQKVVEKVDEIATAQNLPEAQKDLVILAAWMHDTGFVRSVEGHEKESMAIAEAFFKDSELSKADLDQLLRCIEATTMPQSPSDTLSEILCDADLYHLGTEEFEERSTLLRLEIESLCSSAMSDLEWLEKNDAFLKEHKYFTHYAYSHWGAMKDKNWLTVKRNLKKFRQKEEERQLKTKLKNESAKIKKDKGSSPDRGIQTLYRVTLRNHIKLSDIADTKANILLSVNAIILSIALSILFPKLDKPANNYLIIPTLFFLLTTIAAIVCSILATRPKVTTGKFTSEDVQKRKVNLLFFGNFHKMPLSDFQDGMKDIMKDKDYLYESLMKDLYYLGIVLNKKYMILRYAYNIFMFGIIVSVIAFIISFMSLN